MHSLDHPNCRPRAAKSFLERWRKERLLLWDDGEVRKIDEGDDKGYIGVSTELFSIGKDGEVSGAERFLYKVEICKGQFNSFQQHLHLIQRKQFHTPQTPLGHTLAPSPDLVSVSSVSTLPGQLYIPSQLIFLMRQEHGSRTMGEQIGG
jgi:hypothetical protein